MGKASRRKKVTNPDKLAAYRAPIPFVARPFEGLPKEVELVAMREIIPCATMTAVTNKEHGGVEFDLVTLLPDGHPAMVRPDGRILVALQTRFNSADLSHDVAAAVLAAIAAKDNGDEGVIDFDVREPSERLQDIIDPESFTAMVIAEDFSYWFSPDEDIDEQTQRALQQNREEIIPTEAIAEVPGMFWCEMNRNFVRFVTDIDESPLFNGLARLAVAGKAHVGEGSRFVGAFRACGIAIPVFELAEDATASDVAADAKAFADELDQALKVDEPLSADERRIRQGLVSRQVTIR
ncbi:DUF5926 family protein [Schaalia vaccimaxillae]|uniref:DUF5926 family protein n=1 Tax=Schaalia vaccimaxillae TaxID=183916 RepID=UPI0003B6C3CE|nr:DUF5926 family protein [Schaalia vaccimaxillae]